jgi:hypothetical protein
MRKSLGAHATSKGEQLSYRPAGFAILALVTMNACSSGRVAPDPTCPHPRAASTPPQPDQLAALAGRYEMTLVNVNGEYGDSIVRGILVLWANGSARRYLPRAIGRRPGERPLAGKFESESSTVPSVPNSYEPGTPEDPAVEMAGDTIYLGGLEYSDGGGNHLGVQEITPTGFRGTWIYSPGFSVTVDSATGRVIREPSGYFCGRRAPST